MSKALRTCFLVAVFAVVATGAVLPWNTGGSGVARAQTAGPVDLASKARAAAKDWAFALLQSLSQSEGRRMTFQHMDQDDMLSPRHRRRLYRLMLSTLQEVGAVLRYNIMDPADSVHVARALEQADVLQASDVYIQTLRKHSLTELNLWCKASPEGNRVKLACTVQRIETTDTAGQASVSFDLEWLARPLAMEQALDAVAAEIVAGLRGGGNLGELQLVDYQKQNRETDLTRSIARKLRVKLINRRRERGGWQLAKQGTIEAAKHRMNGGIDLHGERLELQVTVHLGDEEVNAVEEHIALASVPKRLLESAGDAGQGGTEKKEAAAPSDDRMQAVQRDKYVRGVERMFEVGNYPRVLSYIERLDRLGVAVPDEIDHYRGVALFHRGRFGEAEAALQRYVGAVGEGGEYYDASLGMLLDLEDREYAAFARAESQGTVEGYQAYLDVYPRGSHAGEARLRKGQLVLEAADRTAFAEAQSKDTVASYQEYLFRYPNGIHEREARVRKGELELDHGAFAQAELLGTVEGYQAYLDAHPQGRHVREAIRRRDSLAEEAADHAAFAQAKSRGTIGAYQGYLDAFPQGLHVEEATRLRDAMVGKARDDKAFAYAVSQGTVKGYREYLEKFPQGLHAEEAARRRDALVAEAADRAAFAQARLKDTVASYREYLSAYPDGAHVRAARERKGQLERDRAAFAAAEATGTAEGYQRYLKEYPQGVHAKEAKRRRGRLAAAAAEREAFARARSRDTVEAYEEYLTRYANGAHARQARERKAELESDDAAFARAETQGTVEGYLEYVEARPQGRHAEEAKRRIEQLRKEAADSAAFARTQDTVEAYEAYLTQYPNGIHSDEVRRRLARLIADHRAFDSARAADTPASYDAYLASYSDGRHVDEAQRLRAAAVEREAIAVETRVQMKPLEKVQIEQSLASTGRDVGAVDGEFTEQTRAALRSWQAAKGVDQTGYLTQDQADALMRDGKEFKDCRECPEMVFVPAGSFTMGSRLAGETEQPEHLVTIPSPFAVGKFEVTFAEWDACVRDGGCEGYRPEDHGWGFGRRPAIEVTWAHAKAYTDWLSRKTGKEYRLLSESEWEYVARAGATTDYWWGDEIGKARANCDGCGSRWDDEKTAPVGSFGANEFGLYDVHGNVWEWVEDCWKETYDGVPSDGTAWQPPAYETCAAHVIRGGSWNEWPSTLRLGLRSYDNLTWFSPRHDEIGFRVARTLAR